MGSFCKLCNIISTLFYLKAFGNFPLASHLTDNIATTLYQYSFCHKDSKLGQKNIPVFQVTLEKKNWVCRSFFDSPVKQKRDICIAFLAAALSPVA